MRRKILEIILAAAAACLLAGGGVAPAAGAPASQPTVIPGKWKLTDQPSPPLEQITKKAPAAPVYGLYLWCDEYKAYRDSIKKVGWKSIRVAGPFGDESFAMMEADGMEVMKCLDAWDMAGAAGNKGKNRADYADDESFLADYVKCVWAFLARYGPGGTFFQEKAGPGARRPVRHVEIWNEPNFQYLIPESNNRQRDEAKREALYAKVLPAAYEAIKKDWPDVQVLGFGAGGGNAGDLRFIKNVLAKDPRIARSFDILSTHPYVAPVPPEVDAVRSWGSYSVARSLDTIRKNLAEHKVGDAPVWYTEVGWPISKADGGFYETPKEKEMADMITTPLLQAAYVCRLYAYAMRLGVERVHIMYVRDADNFNAGFFLRGVQHGKWRPSATAVQTMIRMLPCPRIVQALSDGQGGTYAYQMVGDTRVGADQRLLILAWNVEGPRTVEIPVADAKAVLVDMLGNEKELQAKDGKVSVEIGPLPVYIR